MPHALPLRAPRAAVSFRVPARAPSSSLFDCQRTDLVRWAHLGPRACSPGSERTLRELEICISDLQFAESSC